MDKFMENVLSKKDVDNSCIVKLDLQFTKAKNIESTKNVYVDGNAVTKEQELLDEAGKSHWYRVSEVPIEGKDNEISGYVTVLKNIDAEKRLQKQRETFVATLGHDLKNPTVAQMRGLELLLRGDFGEITDEQRNIVEMIFESCKYMNGMLATMLTTYREDDGNVKLDFKEFSLSELVNECICEMKYIALNKNVTLKFEDKLSKKIISADKVQLKRVIMNLISNSIKYAFKDTEINILIFGNDENVHFCFRNKSPYIPPKMQETIFNRYVTFADTHKEAGIGLGLYASKKIIEAHDGEIYLKSYIGDKNEFGFIIPTKHNKSVINKKVCF